MFIFDFFRKNKKCNHSKITPESDFSYCPDCGELIENQWFLVRCSCCGIKLAGTIKNGEIIPEKHFCHNCGNSEFIIEKIDKINFIDINYAVLVKSIVINDERCFSQSWVDSKTPCCKPKLLQQFR